MKIDHPTQKPVILYERAIGNHTEGGEAVYEPFSGSGPAIAACDGMGRICHAIEVDPLFVEADHDGRHGGVFRHEVAANELVAQRAAADDIRRLRVVGIDQSSYVDPLRR